MRVELIGLPGVGKSYYFTEHLAGTHPDPRPVAVGGSLLKKLGNVARGFFCFPRLTALFLGGFLPNGTRVGAKRFVILLERVGRLSAYGSSAVDEGPLQAVWALFYHRDMTGENKRSCARFVEAINVSERVIYVFASRGLRAAFVAQRERKHGLANAHEDAQKQARVWMAFVLREVRGARPEALKGHRVQVST